ELVEDRTLLAHALQQLFPAAMRRVGARPHYGFPPETLERWAHDPQAIVLGARREGAIHAVSIFLTAGNQAEYHLNASDAEGRDMTAWLIWNGIERLRARGMSV